MEYSNALLLEKPQNGIAGLKHWRHDLVAGLLVSLTSLPLSLGIAVASGAPPIAGLTSAIIAGLLFPLIGGAFVTISGPAAGLAPALLAIMTTLGHGNREVGYPLLLAVIAIVGISQIVISLMGAARLSAAFPVAVVEGMLAAIGMMIIAKQLPKFVGHDFHAHEFFGILFETPAELSHAVPKVIGLGLLCLVLMFVLSSKKVRAHWSILNFVPPPLIVVIVGILGGVAMGIRGDFLIHMPSEVLRGIHAPDFRGLFGQQSLWMVATVGVVTLVLIDGVESLATIAAIDKIDPFKRRSNPDRTLFAMGMSNLCSSLIGGLTIIPGGVKSKVCINGGGRTLWANFYNAIFLLIFLFVAKDLIDLIPYSALAAVLIYTGWKMCEPLVWRHIAAVGKEQLFVFATTVAITLATDLLWGIIGGMCAKLLLNLIMTPYKLPTESAQTVSILQVVGYGARHLPQLFRNPVVDRVASGTAYHIYLDGPMVCFNAFHVNREFSRIPSEATEVTVHLGQRVSLIDHTSCENLHHFVEEFQAAGRGNIQLEGFDQFEPRSGHKTGVHVPRRNETNGSGRTARDAHSENGAEKTMLVSVTVKSPELQEVPEETLADVLSAD
jgi:MFS superfamily sulfate permease-like transporter